MEFETEGKIASAMRLCCGEGGLITDHMTLDIMNGAPGGTTCPACGGEDILWTLPDGTRTITKDPTGEGTQFFGVYLDMCPREDSPYVGAVGAVENGPTMTLRQFRDLTRDVPGNTYVTAYDPKREWYVNLGITQEAIDNMKPEDGTPSLVLDVTGDTDTRQW